MRLKHQYVTWIQLLQLNFEFVWSLDQTNMDIKSFNDVLNLVNILNLKSKLLLLPSKGCFGIHQLLQGAGIVLHLLPTPLF